LAFRVKQLEMFRKTLTSLDKLLARLGHRVRADNAHVVVRCDESALHSKTTDALELPQFSSATADLPVGSTELKVGDTVWSRVATLDGAKSSDRIYVLDPVARTIRFGDGMEGRKPPVGETVRVRYRYGVGPAGNVTYRVDDTGYSLATVEIANVAFRIEPCRDSARKDP
jgi:hypothetical protein